MNGQMNIKRAIEAQRKRLDRMAGQTRDLSMLLDEARKMDWLIELYENRRTKECIVKDA